MSNPIVRRDSFVRSLSAQTQITAENAFIDRIRLDVGDWALSGDTDQICDALTNLREAETYTANGECVQLFNNHIIEAIWNVRGLKFNSNPNRDNLAQNAPLLSGKVDLAMWQYRPVSRQPGEQARIVFETQLNLTRFIQAQRLKRITRLDRPKLASEYILAISPEESWYETETPLRPATNLIIGPNKKYAFALSQSMTQQLEHYLTVACDTLSNVMLEAFDGSRATATHIPYLSLKEIEFYWEFDSDAPIDWVLSMREILAQQSESFGEDMYQTTHPSLQTQNQSPCFTLRMTQFIRIKVYAKTNRRVRFEVKLKENAINNTAGRRTHDSIDGVLSMIAPLAQEAAKRLRPVLQSIAAEPQPRGSFTAVELMHQILRASDDPHVSETIIASLVTFGRIAPYNNDPIRHAIKKLKELKVPILRPRIPRSRICVVTDEYRDALASLRLYR
ncbi:hypothetical protein SAMN05421665_1464 [Yoonia rosea]|uniref:Uncharacterized protein n=1 Tax=Yoonia rosea TaxID=287098 RepID=A0A1R3WWL8_9RHOB|nr:hypothetical protein [Yoonia rosea]SIT82454.1 hypothetical protein SAMN05421665_1464 [Yoonia rosea]